jgi:small conductance mechanosensitive channel
MDIPRSADLLRNVLRLFSEPLELLRDVGRGLFEWLDRLLFVVLVILLARLSVAVVNWLVRRLELPARVGLLEVDPKRLWTFKQFLRSAAAYTIYFLALVFVLSRFGVDPSPFLVGASGLLAIAIGFGSQGLVQDLVTGLFILLEKQYAVGDFVEIGGVSGFVEDVGIRVTRIRDVNGALRMIPNRTVTSVGNYPQGYMEAIVDVFPADPGQLARLEVVVAEVGRRLDEELDVVLLPPRLSQPLTDGEPRFLRAVLRILPLQQWAVDREFVGRLEAALEAEAIALGPSGIRVVYQCDRVAFYNNLNRIKSRWTEAAPGGAG